MVDDDERTVETHEITVGAGLGAAAADTARLIVLAGPDAGRRHTFRASVTAGRSSAAGLSLRDGSASREHARVARAPTGAWIAEDLGSTNGTFVNGVVLERPTEVRFGDRLLVGDTLMLFTHADPLEDRIVQREKLEIVGRLAAGMTHDLNNLLAVIGAGAEHALTLVQDGDVSGAGAPELLECLGDVMTATRCSGELTRHLLDFARREGSDVGVVDVSELVEEALDLASRTFRAGLQVSRAVQPGLLVSGNRGQLHQVLMNLLLNARDAMPDGGKLRVAAALGSAERVRITVEDSGQGMDTSTRSRLFTPFFTTKAGGHGLGLATVHAVITAHGGTIDCESAPRRGTAFIVHLPATAGPAERTKRTVSLASPLSASRAATVLVVDDDVGVRRAVSRMVELAGHRALLAGTAREAMGTIEARSPAVDVMVLDLDLPDLDAHSMLLALASQGVVLPTVVVSGRMDQDYAELLMAAGARHVLSKPFAGPELLSAVAACVGGVPARPG